MLDRPSGGNLRKSGDLARLHQARALTRPAAQGSGQNLPAIYLNDLGPRRVANRVKWLVSTLFVGAAGLCIIGILIYASMSVEDGSGVIGSMRKAGVEAMRPKQASQTQQERPAAIGIKTDRIVVSSKGLATKHLIYDQVVQRRGTRDFLSNKPYARLVASLATDRPANASLIPAFNPIDLFGDDAPIAKRETAASITGSEVTTDPRVTVRFIDVAGGFLPNEDGQNFSEDDVMRLVAEADAAYAESTSSLLEGADSGQVSVKPQQLAIQLPQLLTTVLLKQPEDDESDEAFETRAITAKGNETLDSAVKSFSADAVQAVSISDMLALSVKGRKLKAGDELRFALLPSATEEGGKDIIKVSLFSQGTHVTTVARNAAGEYELRDDPVVMEMAGGDDGESQQKASVYTSTWRAAQSQELPQDFMTKFFRIHSYDVDFKLKVRPGDQFELFYDLIQDENGVERPGELLFAAITVGGETRGYYRFRSPNGEVDYFDEKGSNSKKFLMRTPVKAGRLTSGYGFRKHPLLGIRKLHTGVDWAAPTGTPIMAAGNGTIEVAGREGGYGNYVRIRHANGYKTAYGHMVRFAEGVTKGVKVRQGQLIGYVGSTGLSSGPHLHYEVLVNARFVNPLSIKVPRARQLQGRLLTEFKREKSRIDDLMKRAPVKTRVASVER